MARVAVLAVRDRDEPAVLGEVGDPRVLLVLVEQAGRRAGREHVDPRAVVVVRAADDHETVATEASPEG